MHPKCLVVEGKDDLYTIAYWIGEHIPWPSERPPVEIMHAGSVEAALKKNYLSTLALRQDLNVLAVIVDADEEPASRRYGQIRSECLQVFPNLPKALPRPGLAHEHAGKRFGVWIMPDNHGLGNMESLLASLATTPSSSLLSYARQCTLQARKQGALYRQKDRAKAELYTWLAWQDPPGQLTGRAFTKGILDAKSPAAQPFVNWFLELFQLR
ncbi:MAG: hypothetical protein HY820_06335 [Acidobacteria bacterium]|nr:hypothetical protein [Acidobacteriota bacterium]